MKHFTLESDEIVADINITPLVDIMLVLLITFMMVSTIMEMKLIKVQVPHASTGADAATGHTVSILITKEDRYFLCGKPMDSYEILVEALRDRKIADPDMQVVISADQEVAHGRVVRIIDAVRLLQITKFAIQVEPFSESTNS